MRLTESLRARLRILGIDDECFSVRQKAAAGVRSSAAAAASSSVDTLSQAFGTVRVSEPEQLPHPCRDALRSFLCAFSLCPPYCAQPLSEELQLDDAACEYGLRGVYAVISRSGQESSVYASGLQYLAALVGSAFFRLPPERRAAFGIEHHLVKFVQHTVLILRHSSQDTAVVRTGLTILMECMQDVHSQKEFMKLQGSQLVSDILISYPTDAEIKRLAQCTLERSESLDASDQHTRTESFENFTQRSGLALDARLPLMKFLRVVFPDDKQLRLPVSNLDVTPEKLWIRDGGISNILAIMDRTPDVSVQIAGFKLLGAQLRWHGQFSSFDEEQKTALLRFLSVMGDSRCATQLWMVVCDFLTEFLRGILFIKSSSFEDDWNGRRGVLTHGRCLFKPSDYPVIIPILQVMQARLSVQDLTVLACGCNLLRAALFPDDGQGGTPNSSQLRDGVITFLDADLPNIGLLWEVFNMAIKAIRSDEPIDDEVPRILGVLTQLFSELVGFTEYLNRFPFLSSERIPIKKVPDLRGFMLQPDNILVLGKGLNVLVQHSDASTNTVLTLLKELIPIRQFTAAEVAAFELAIPTLLTIITDDVAYEIVTEALLTIVSSSDYHCELRRQVSCRLQCLYAQPALQRHFRTDAARHLLQSMARDTMPEVRTLCTLLGTDSHESHL